MNIVLPTEVQCYLNTYSLNSAIFFLDNITQNLFLFRNKSTEETGLSFTENLGATLSKFCSQHSQVLRTIFYLTGEGLFYSEEC